MVFKLRFVVAHLTDSLFVAIKVCHGGNMDREGIPLNNCSMHHNYRTAALHHHCCHHRGLSHAPTSLVRLVLCIAGIVCVFLLAGSNHFLETPKVISPFPNIPKFVRPISTNHAEKPTKDENIETQFKYAYIDKPITEPRYDRLIKDVKTEKPINNEKTEEQINNKNTEKTINNEKTEKTINNEKTEKTTNNEKTEKPINDKKTELQMDESQMTERIHEKEHACSHIHEDAQVKEINAKRLGYKPITVYLPEHNLSYCGVGKAGGTFLKQMFSVLTDGVNKSKELENLNRQQVHRKMINLKTSFTGLEWREAKLITVGRNPYSRLFSAYIDRVFAPCETKSFREGAKCRYDVTFEEFLRIAINRTERGGWSPIYYICWPCNVTSTFIVKQETFTDDIKFMIEKLGVSIDKQTEIVRKLTESRVDWTITGIVIDKMRQSKAIVNQPGCIGWFDVIKLIWKTFQITGYIDEKVDLPLTLYNRTDDFSNAQVLLKTIFDTIEKHPMSDEAMEAQRYRALVNAYSHVDKEVVDDIKRVYRPDFDMFGYSSEPPK